MESLKSALALILCGTLCTPAPFGYAQAGPSPDDRTASRPHRPAYESAQLQGDERILQALDRFTFGPRSGDADQLRAMGLDAWFDQQLHPATLDETELNARLAQYPAMQWSVQDLVYRIPSNASIRQAMNGRESIPARGTLHAVYENQIYRLQEKQAAKQEKKQADAETPVQIPAAPRKLRRQTPWPSQQRPRRL